MANYDDWRDAVHYELKLRDLDGALTGWNWRHLYEDNVKPKEAVEDYVKWLDREAE